ncbi:unnamed protein product [Discosporangium mesarthrocarpum]
MVTSEHTCWMFSVSGVANKGALPQTPEGKGQLENALKVEFQEVNIKKVGPVIEGGFDLTIDFGEMVQSAGPTDTLRRHFGTENVTAQHVVEKKRNWRFCVCGVDESCLREEGLDESIRLLQHVRGQNKRKVKSATIHRVKKIDENYKVEVDIDFGHPTTCKTVGELLRHYFQGTSVTSSQLCKKGERKEHLENLPEEGKTPCLEGASFFILPPFDSTELASKQSFSQSCHLLAHTYPNECNFEGLPFQDCTTSIILQDHEIFLHGLRNAVIHIKFETSEEHSHTVEAKPLEVRDSPHC